MGNLGPFKLTLVVEGENKKRVRIDTHHLVVPSYAVERVPIINEIVEYTLGEDTEYLNIIDVETTLPMAKQALKGKVSIEDINYILRLLSIHADTMDFFAYFNDVKDVIPNQHYVDFSKYKEFLKNSNLEYHTIGAEKEDTKQLVSKLEDNDKFIDTIMATMFCENLKESFRDSSAAFIANSEYDKAFEVIKRVFNRKKMGTFERNIIHNFTLALHVIKAGGDESYVEYRYTRDLINFFVDFKFNLLSKKPISEILYRINLNRDNAFIGYLKSLNDNEQSLNFIKEYHRGSVPEEEEADFEDTEFFKRLKALVLETENDPTTYLIEEIKGIQEMSKAFEALSHTLTYYISVSGRIQIYLNALVDILIKSKALKYLEADFYRHNSKEVDKMAFYYLSKHEKKIKEIVG